MHIEFDITVSVTQEFIDYQFMDYEEGYAPTAEEVVRRVLKDIDGSHEIAISNVVHNYKVTHSNMVFG